MTETSFWNLFAKKLTGEANHGELIELEKLMRSSPELLYAAQHIEDLWSMSTKTEINDLELKFDQHLLAIREQSMSQIPPSSFSHQTAVKKPAFAFTKSIGIFMAAGILLVAALVVMYKFFSPELPQTAIQKEAQLRQVFCPDGIKTRLILPDSSIAWLNSGSRIEYNEEFGISNRTISLTGEAFFDVKKSLTPFIINVANIQIKVLGTAFNVRAYPHENKTETSLIRGLVEISRNHSPEERIVLKENEKLTINNLPAAIEARKKTNSPLIILSSLKMANDSTAEEISWVIDKLEFQGETFEQLANKMEHWYSVKILFRDEKLKQLRFTGVFKNETIEQALEALKFSSAFSYSIKNNLIEISN